jgi:hypothetical protein
MSTICAAGSANNEPELVGYYGIHQALLAYKPDDLSARGIPPMNALLKFAAIALVGTATLASPAFAALKEGAQAPDFSAPAYLAGQPFTFKLADALKKGPVVVYFFPAAHTSGCNIEAHLFSEAIDQFKAQHATVIGVTAGNISELAAFFEGNRALRRQVPGRRR